MAEVTTKVCDVDPVLGMEAKSYTVSEGARKVTKDLCATCAAPFEALLDGKAKPTPAKKTAGTRRPGRRSSAHVVSLAEIDRAKQQQI